MQGIKIVYWANIVISGLCIGYMSTWFAAGFIAEYPEGSGIVAPEYLVCIPGWLIPAVLSGYLLLKKAEDRKEALQYLYLSFFMTWLFPYFSLLFLHIIGLA
ncbi:hypothetical protein [Halobacillus salinus]|uniref:hypothetical protein n=1 Tax=Halobacillus salinus TaxID=192814 RepID=UPI0009A74516|nr:hypothetical protein [Halobacillus salinus]